MKTIKYQELRRRYQLDGADKTVTHLSEALSSGDLKPDDFSIRDLAEGLIPDGHQWVRELDPRSSRGMTVTEAFEGVDVTAIPVAKFGTSRIAAICPGVRRLAQVGLSHKLEK